MGLLGFSSQAYLFIEMPYKHYITASLLVLESFMWMSLTISSIQQILSCNFGKIMREMKRVCLFIMKYRSLMTDLNEWKKLHQTNYLLEMFVTSLIAHGYKNMFNMVTWKKYHMRPFTFPHIWTVWDLEYQIFSLVSEYMQSLIV